MGIEQVHSAAARCFHPQAVSVRTLGSLAQDTCIASSDVDMCLFFDSPKPRPQHARKLLRCLSRELWRTPAARSLQIVDEILEATVPILRVRTRDARRLEADISLGSQLENSCDEVVRSLLAKHGIARRCVLLIKCWAHRHSVNKAFHGYPSSFCWVLLGIFYLQLVGILPRKRGGYRAAPPGKSLRQLLAGFFAFCGTAELRDRSQGVSVAKGGFVRLSEPSQALFIEVPGEPANNAARCLRPHRWVQVLKKARLAHQLLTTGPTTGCLHSLMYSNGADSRQDRLGPPWSDSEDSSVNADRCMYDLDGI